VASQGNGSKAKRKVGRILKITINKKTILEGCASQALCNKILYQIKYLKTSYCSSIPFLLSSLILLTKFFTLIHQREQYKSPLMRAEKSIMKNEESKKTREVARTMMSSKNAATRL